MSGSRRLGVAGVAALLIGGIVAGSLDAKPKRRQNAQALAKQFEIATIARDVEQPSGIDFLPDGTLLVTEKDGKLWAFKGPDDRRLVLDISDHVANQRERGFNGVAVDPDFANNRRVYLLYAFKVNPGTGRQAMRLTSITLNPGNTVANPGSPETVILGKDASPGKGCPPISNKRDCPASINSTHQGGTVIADDDGTLWVGLGDSNLPSNPGAQTLRTFDPKSTAGKILHIDREGNGLPGHPFCKGTKNLTRTCTKVHATGFRNPFRFSLTPRGDPLVGDVGWNLREEIDLVKAGRNYGWPCFEGDLKTPFYRELAACRRIYGRGKKEDLAKPEYDYRNPPGGGAAGAAVIVGPHYASGTYPDSFDGGYFFGDYAKAFIKLIKLKKGKAKTTPLVTGIAPVDLKIGPNGNLVFADFVTGAVRELRFAPDNKTPEAKISASPTSGQAPLTVSFSGLGSSDPDGEALTYDWDFGDGSPHSSDPAPEYAYPADGVYTARLTVTDSRGASDTATTTIVVGNTAPAASMVAPVEGTLSRAGELVNLAATGSDPEDGVLGPAAFSWNVVLFHKAHQHPLATLIGNPAQFEAVTDHDADSFYEITLTVTDSGGLSTTLPPVTVQPETVPLRILSRPGGVEVDYGGREVKTKKQVKAAIGYRANLSAPAKATIGGVTYNFHGWSQGGRRVQIYTIPDRKSSVRALYKRSK